MRFVILNSVDWEGCRALADARLPDERAMRHLTGCAWLFRAGPGVDDVAEAAREAILDFFASARGREIRSGERIERLGWEEAIPWIPDEVWERHGLEMIRSPEVERVLLDGGEDLAEGMDEGTYG